MEIGKIPAALLEQMILNPIANSAVKRAEVKNRPTTGEDCAVVDIGEELLVVSTDPITGASQDAAYLAVHINCNDIAAAGGEPIGILLTALLPPNTSAEDIETMMAGARKAAEEVNIVILGGHTEITDAVTRPVLSGTVIGKTRKRNFISSGGAKVGQKVVMTKWAGLEGTAIIAADYEVVLKKQLPDDLLKKAKGLKKLLSVVPEGKIGAANGVTAMHDATEGGVLGAVWEVAACSNTGVTVYEDQVPILPETKAVCEAASIDPYRLVSSGVMIMTVQNGGQLVAALQKAGIPAAIIGEITEGNKLLIKEGKEYPLMESQGDALYQVKLQRKKE